MMTKKLKSMLKEWEIKYQIEYKGTEDHLPPKTIRKLLIKYFKAGAKWEKTSEDKMKWFR